MELPINNPTGATGQPMQFGLAKLMQFMTVAALWCSAAIVRDNVVLGMVYAVVVVTATWTVVGRWAVRLSPVMCRRVLAATITLLVAGGFGVTLLVEDESYFPLVWLLTALVAALPWAVMRFGVVWGVAAGIACDALLLLLIYYVWLSVFRSWDRFSERPDQRRLARFFSVQLVLLALPVGFSVLSGCYAFHEHSGALDMHHLWLHCIIHVAMLAAACWIVVLLQRHTRRTNDPPPNSLKLVTWGYLCYYAVLLQVALFPIKFYIP